MRCHAPAALQMLASHVLEGPVTKSSARLLAKGLAQKQGGLAVRHAKLGGSCCTSWHDMPAAC
jgi:hypothetical protein